MNNMTALVSCFARYYHTKTDEVKIFADPLAGEILSEDEKNAIAENMKNGIAFFDPNYSCGDPLGRVMNGFIAPSVIARSAFCKRHMENEIRLGARQYVIAAAGYDTSGYKIDRDIKVFELDRPEMIEDKVRRIDEAGIDRENISYVGCDLGKGFIPAMLNAGYDPKERTFFSLLGISFYLTQDKFARCVKILFENSASESALVFDFPNDRDCTREQKNRLLAGGAGEEMKARYSHTDIERIAGEAGALIYELAYSGDIDRDFFKAHNEMKNAEPILAPEGVSYCLMVKKDGQY